MESVAQKASGYVVPSTTVPAAARALSYAELRLADALMGQADTIVVEAVVVTSQPVIVLVDVSQLAELLNSTELVIEVQVTYKSYPVVLLVQELVEEVDEVDEVDEVELVESVGEAVDGIFIENPSDDSISAGGGGKMPGPVMPGIMMPEPPPPPIGGQNQQFATGIMGQPYWSVVDPEPELCDDEACEVLAEVVEPEPETLPLRDVRILDDKMIDEFTLEEMEVWVVEMEVLELVPFGYKARCDVTA
ncbi:MAG: hypothetical protein Q9165_006510 [Trypethelium subeluteriae]